MALVKAEWNDDGRSQKYRIFAVRCPSWRSVLKWPLFLFLHLLGWCYCVLIRQTSSTYIKQNNETFQSSIPLGLCKYKTVLHRRTIESPDVAACTICIREEEKNMCATFTLYQITTSAIRKHTPVAGGLSVTSSVSQWKGENSHTQTYR